MKEKNKFFLVFAVVGIVVIFINICQYFSNIDSNRKFVNGNIFVQADSELGWANRPSHSFEWPVNDPFWDAFDKIRYEINQEGQRYDPNSQADRKDAGASPIWILGDSSPFGLGVSAENIFAERLKESFRGKSVAFQNYSVIGYNSSQLLKVLKAKLETAAFKPKILILWGGFNDAVYTRKDQWRLRQISWLAFYRVQNNIKSIVNLCLNNNIQIIINTLPSYEPSAYLTKYNHWLRKQFGGMPNVYINDVQENFGIRDQLELYAEIDDKLPAHFHPSKQGHEIIHDMIYPIIAGIIRL